MFGLAIAEFELTLTFANAPIDRFARGQRDAMHYGLPTMLTDPSVPKSGSRAFGARGSSTNRVMYITRVNRHFLSFGECRVGITRVEGLIIRRDGQM